MPSGIFRPSLTITFRSEPSGFAVSTRPALTSKKNRRPVVAGGTFLAGFCLATVVDIEFTYSFSAISNEYNQIDCKGLAIQLRSAMTLPFNEIPVSDESAVCQWFISCQRIGSTQPSCALTSMQCVVWSYGSHPRENSEL